MNIQADQMRDIFKSITLLATSSEHDTLELLDARVCVSGELPLIADKWVLSSALQKLIRRGKVNQAILVALKIQDVDAGYLRRRLPVIALEDIGIGDLSACARVTAACSDLRPWRDAADETIASLVALLARAVKSRAACDALCLSEAHPETPGMMAQLLGSTPVQLIAVASDTSAPRIARMNAFRVLGGITQRHGLRYQVLSRCEPAALDLAAINLGLSQECRWLIARSAKTGGMAAMLPMVAEASSGATVRTGGEFPHSLDMVYGVPLCALDQHSRPGRAALHEFFMASPGLRAFAGRSVRAKGIMPAFHTAIFHMESAILDRYLSSPGLDELTSETECEEMRDRGMVNPSDRHELHDLILVEADRLAEIRRRSLTEAVNTAIRCDAFGGEDHA